MAINKGPNSTRPRHNPRSNRSSRAQRIRRAKEKESLIKLHNQPGTIDESFQKCPEDVAGINDLPVSLKPSKEVLKLLDYSPSMTIVNSANVIKTGNLSQSKQNQKKLLVHSVSGNKSSGVTNSSRPRSYPTREARPIRRAKENALWKLYCKPIIEKSFQDCSHKVPSIDFVPSKNKDPAKENSYLVQSFQECSQEVKSIDFVPSGIRDILNPSEENSNLPDHLPLTTVVNSVLVIGPAILRPPKQILKKLLIPGICRNKSSDIANRCRPRSYPNSKSKAQRLRREKEKEALMKMCGKQIIDKRFQDFSQEAISKHSVPTRSREILSTPEKNINNSNISQNLTIIDSVSVIKTEILDPSENNYGLMFQDYSQYATTIGSMPIIKTENLELPRTNEKLPLPNIQLEPTQINNAMDKTSRSGGVFANIINYKRSLKFEKNVLETYPKVHILPKSESPFLLHPPGSHKKNAPKKKKQFGFNCTVQRNKVDKKKHSKSKAKSVCGCFKNAAMRKKLYENYFGIVQQDDANQLCLCMARNHTLRKSLKPDKKAMHKFCLVNPNFGKITSNMKTGLS